MKKLFWLFLLIPFSVYASPLLVGALDGMYRWGEMGSGNNQLAWRKLGCDWLGVLGRVSVEIKF